MSLLEQPIPPRPAVFAPDGAPPGVHLNLDAYRADWVAGRPKIEPRILVVHTNGGGGEGDYAGAIRWSNSSPSNTHAHYNLNAPTPSKNLATDRRAIANSTPKHIEEQYGERDVSYWSIAIETADRGYRNGGNVDLGDFLYDHDELVARIIAYESIVWGFPIAVPNVWNGTGVVTHTEPFDGVYTLYTGKTCPGLTKKDRVLRGDILPRAQQIADAWLGVTPESPEEDDPMSLALRWQHPGKGDAQFLIGAGNITRVTKGMVEQWRKDGKLPPLVKEYDDALYAEAEAETFSVSNDPDPE